MTLLACLLQAMRERAPETPVPAGLLLAELLCLRSAGSQPGRQPPVHITSTLQAVEERAHDAADYSGQHAQLATEVQQLRASLAQLSADHKATEEQLRRRKAKNMQEVEVGLGALCGRTTPAGSLCSPAHACCIFRLTPCSHHLPVYDLCRCGYRSMMRTWVSRN